ncbi:MAG: SPOR domain-containing protein [Gammaproteobacteria bacterium]|nr:SPOR domain-containing protein [Gammaproteobacteria bacterium]
MNAVQLINEKNYSQARIILNQAANNADPVAMYNLGVMQFSGMGETSNTEAAKSWFNKATKYKLVEAYNRVQLNTIAPAGTTPVINIQTPQEWIKIQNPDYYTLQLASSTNRKLIEKYYIENQLEGKAGYYINRRAGEDWYALVYGSYPSAGEASDAIVNLPKDLRKWSPWVRKLKDIQRLVKE